MCTWTRKVAQINVILTQIAKILFNFLDLCLLCWWPELFLISKWGSYIRVVQRWLSYQSLRESAPDSWNSRIYVFPCAILMVFLDFRWIHLETRTLLRLSPYVFLFIVDKRSLLHWNCFSIGRRKFLISIKHFSNP